MQIIRLLLFALPSLVEVAFVVAVQFVGAPVVIIPFIILDVICVFWPRTALMGDRQLKCTFADLPDDLSLCAALPFILPPPVSVPDSWLPDSLFTCLFGCLSWHHFTFTSLLIQRKSDLAPSLTFQRDSGGQLVLYLELCTKFNIKVFGITLEILNAYVTSRSVGSNEKNQTRGEKSSDPLVTLYVFCPKTSGGACK